MVQATDFKAAMRNGSHAASPNLVVHYLADEASVCHNPLVGFVVPKREIARANKRNLVKRRLRHLMRGRLGELGQGDRLVIRAKAGCLDLDYRQLGTELDKTLGRAIRRAERRGGQR